MRAGYAFLVWGCPDRKRAVRADITAGKVASCPCRDDADFRRIRQPAIDTYPITPVAWNWDVRHWEGQRYYAAVPAPDPRWAEWVRLWETADGRLVGVAHPEERPGEAFLQLHPDHRCLEEEMVAWCEEYLVVEDECGRRLRLHVHDYDASWRRLLRARGWEEEEEWGMARRLRLGACLLPVPPLPTGHAA
jgi:hypothetical protein